MYSAGYLDTRVVTQVISESDSTGEYGFDTGAKYVDGETYWAHVAQTKGAKAMREGATDAYFTIQISTRYHSSINSDTRFKWDGKVYKQIAPPMVDKGEDEMQFVCEVVVKDDSNEEPESGSSTVNLED